MLKKYILFSLVSIFSLTALSQGSVVVPLSHNNNIKTYLAAHKGYVWGMGDPSVKTKWQVNDTLDLPFFDDFYTATEIYPDSNKWINNTVYINNGFAIKPPSLGVATFDALDAQGNPYFGFAPQAYGIADTLTSQPINLDSFFIGANGFKYSLADSLYLSFYYQPQGNGDDVRAIDSLLVQFKSRGQAWITVWATGGVALDDFNKVMVPVLDTFYLHNNFQFRFLNYANYKGSVSHWNVDYVHMDRNRSIADSATTNDVTISGLPTSVLRYYSTMPWNQFIADPTRELADSHYFYIHNLGTNTANMEYRHEAKTMGGASIVVNDFANNNENIVSGQQLRWGFLGYQFDTMTTTGSPVFVERNYRIRNDIGNPNNDNTDNDALTVKQEFGKYLAYDDGTAELGYGISYGSLPDNAETRVAMKFHLNEPDTLWGVSIFFNQSVEDASTQIFHLEIWGDINTQNQTEMLIHDEFAGSPVYTDSINGFHTFLFQDTNYLILPAGDFYIGWRQNSRFIINIGYDANYISDLNNPDDIVRNPNLVENVTGTWRNVHSSITGAPMIRAVVEYDPIFVGVKKVEEKVEWTVNMYPNPAQDQVKIDTDEELEYTIIDVTGKVVLQGTTWGEIDITSLVSGTYFVRFSNSKKSAYCTKKLIVTK